MSDYPYILGLFRSLEGKLLNSGDIERMIDAPDIEAAFRVFNDTEYADNLLEVEAKNFKKALDDDLKQTRNLYEKFVDDKKIRQFLFLRYDFHNLKLIFKEKYSKKDLKEEESQVGTIAYSSLRNYILEGARVDLPSKLKKVIDQASQEFEKNHQPHYIDTYLDKKMYKLLVEITEKINNKFISDFLKMKIDMVNIKIFLRAKNLKKEVKWLSEQIIIGGRIAKKEFENVYDKNIKEALDTFLIYFDKKFINIISDFEENHNLWQLEQQFENYEMDYLSQTKRMSFGPEMAIAYYFAKKNALRNVRLIMTGKLNKVKPSEIRERVRNLW